MIYTKEMAKAIREIPQPIKIKLAIVDCGNYYGIRVYEKDIMQYDIDKRIAIHQYLFTVQDMLKSFGLNAILEGHPDVT